MRALSLALALGAGAAMSPAALAEGASSRSEAIAQALARSGGEGRVLGVRESREGDTVVYAVKVLTEGRVRVIRIRGRGRR